MLRLSLVTNPRGRLGCGFKYNERQPRYRRRHPVSSGERCLAELAAGGEGELEEFFHL